MPDLLAIDKERLQDLIDGLIQRGYQVIGPILERGSITYAPLEGLSQLPVGYIDEQSGGHYRIRPAAEGGPNDRALFRYTLGSHTWKRFLFPARQRLWQGQRTGTGFSLEADAQTPPRYAFLGVRACELAAMGIQDRVFDNGDFADSGYRARREAAFIIALNCIRAGDTCFCASMGTGPAVTGDFDLSLTELVDPDAHRFLVAVGSERGARILEEIPHRPATPEEIAQAQALVEAASGHMGRRMPAEAPSILKRSLEHGHWRQVAQRCLNCANCTLVCPTCFCSTTEDRTSLDGKQAERWRVWDSCFTLSYSYIHGGPHRREGATRYRQWITHKLAFWVDQFGTSGCTGCGRCITWCPVGIDITEEVAALQESAAAPR